MKQTMDTMQTNTGKMEQTEQKKAGIALADHPLEQIDMNEHDPGTEELADRFQAEGEEAGPYKK